MKNKTLHAIALWVMFISMFGNMAFAQETGYGTRPVHRGGSHEKWRIAYYQGGEYGDYRQTLVATIEGLMLLGWIPTCDTEVLANLDAREIWEWLAENGKSGFLQFLADGFYTTRWNADLRPKVADDIEKRARHDDGFDLLIAMGTWAGQDLARRALDTNVLVFSTSDPVSAGIIKSPYDSGAANLHAQVDPTIYGRQVELFHEIIGFNRLGVIYENSVAGRSYAGMDSVERLSGELGFEIVACYAASDIPDSRERERQYLECLDHILPQIDALYVSAHGGVTESALPAIAQRAKRRRVPTFSQAGAFEVEKGLLMSLSRTSFKKVGLFNAAIMANVLSGAKPGQLKQVFEEPLSISLNITTAESISYIPGADILAGADNLYK